MNLISFPNRTLYSGWHRRVPRVARHAAFVTVVLTSIVFTIALAAQNSATPTPLQLEIEKQRQRLSSPEVEERRDALMRLAAMRRAEAARAALSALSDPVPLIRATAAATVAHLPADEAIASLVPLLSDKDEFVRCQTAYALGNTRSRSAVTPLVERLRLDKFDSVRAAAAVSLGQIGDESAVVPLAEILSESGGKKQKREKNEFILRASAHSLGQLRSRAAVPALLNLLGAKSMSSDVRREAAQSLGLIGDATALSALEALALEGDPYLTQVANSAIRQINSRTGKANP